MTEKLTLKEKIRHNEIKGAIERNKKEILENGHSGFFVHRKNLSNNGLTDEQKANLEPCPFCGAKRVIRLKIHYSKSEPLFSITCGQCETETKKYITKKNAIWGWNQRAGVNDEINKKNK